MMKFPLYPLNLQFFAEEGGAGAGGGQQTPPNNTGEGNQNPPEGQGSSNNAGQQQGGDAHQKQEHMIPKTRFDEVNNKLKELQEQLETINKEKEKQELEAKKKKGEFEELYNSTSQELENTKNQFKQTSERVAALEGIIQTLVDAELEAVPEDMRDLVPENFSPEQKLSWITNAKKKGLFGATSNSKENEPLGGSTNQQQQQQIDISKMSPAELLRSAYGTKK